VADLHPWVVGLRSWVVMAAVVVVVVVAEGLELVWALAWVHQSHHREGTSSSEEEKERGPST
jgi:hypothetical protein